MDELPRPQPGFQKTLLINALVPIGVIVMLGLLLGFQAMAMRGLTVAVSQSIEASKRANRIASLLELVSLHRLDWLAMGTQGLPQAMQESLNDTAKEIAQLHLSEGDDPLRQARTQNLADRFAAWRARVETTGPEYDGAGSRLNLELREALTLYRANQLGELDRHQDDLTRQTRLASLVGGISLLLALAFFALFSIRQFRLLSESYRDSFNRLAAQTGVLSAQAQALSAQREELNLLYLQQRDQNDVLETAVAERTRALERHARVIDLAHDAISITEIATRKISFWNGGAEALYGYGADEAIGQIGLQLLRIRLPIDESLVFTQLAFTGTWDGEVRAMTKDGRDLIIASRATVIRDADGNPEAVISIERDVTAEHDARDLAVAARAAAEDANKAKSMFLANMSHELRTPLNAILGYSEMLMEEAEDEGRASELSDLKKVNQAGKHLLRLINDILDLSKIEAGKMEVLIEDLDPGLLARELIDTIQPLADQQGDTLTLELGQDLPIMDTDTLKLRQALLNLLSNALKFTEAGHVTLTVQARTLEGRPWVQFIVADTGIGMSDEQMERLFQDFSQADASTTRRYGGTGLGLALSRRFVRMLGGDISVESRPGEGAAFTISLPAKVPTVPPVPQASDAESLSGPATLDAPLVLCIDDDPNVRDLLARFLDRSGYRVATAANGAEGIRLARTLRPAAITLDVMMPGLDGWDVLQSLKADAELAAIPVIIATMIDDRMRGLVLGAADYLVKPIDRPRLAETITRLIQRPPQGPVLVVDDDGDARELLRRALEREGLDVVEATDGEAALALCHERLPVLIVLDLMMPGMDGFTMIDALQAHEALKDIPVVVVSGKDLSRAELDRLERSVEAVLAKGDSGANPQETLLTAIRRRIALAVGRQPGSGMTPGSP